MTDAKKARLVTRLRRCGADRGRDRRIVGHARRRRDGRYRSRAGQGARARRRTRSAIVIVSTAHESTGAGVRFFGPPAGYEFGTLIETIRLAAQLALASPFVTSDIVDATEFPEPADRYHVHGVPRTVINETTAIEGAVPESAPLAELLPLLETV